MAGNTIRAELQEQRRFIEEQRIELERQRQQIKIQFRRTADVQAELDGLKAMLLRQGTNRSSRCTPHEAFIRRRQRVVRDTWPSS